MDLSTYFAGKVIDHLLRNQAYTPPTTVYASLHTADPGLTGASEVSGGSYARQAVTLNAAASKATTSSGDLLFTCPAATVSHVGLWDASTSGNFLLGGPAGTVNYPTTVLASSDTFTAYAHGFATDDRVVFTNGQNTATLPTGITAGTVYYVLASGLTTDAFKVSTTSGGTALDVTANGDCIVRKLVVKTLAAGDQYKVSSGNFAINLF